MNQNLQLFHKWCLINKLSLNIKKTKALPYQSGNLNNWLEGHVIHINGEILEYVNMYTYLGLSLDSQLTIKNHLEHLYRAAILMVFSLASIRKYIDTRTAILIFKAHILSRLEYGSVLCTGVNKIYLDQLQKLVKKFEDLFAQGKRC